MSEPRRARRRRTVHIVMPQGTSPIDLGVALTRAVRDRLEAEVIDYDAGGQMTSIRLRLPSRKQRWAAIQEAHLRCIERSKELCLHSAQLMDRGQEFKVVQLHLRERVDGSREAAQEPPRALLL